MPTEPTESEFERMMELADMANEQLHPDLMPYVEDAGPFGRMLRHPLVYDMAFSALPGLSNKAYAHKRAALEQAEAEQDWHTCVFLHERPYRLWALIEYVTGRDEFGDVLPLVSTDEDTLALVADVWVDSENIQQNEDEWRTLIGDAPDNGLWLGTKAETVEFDALPDPIPAWRGGTVGDWSWTTNQHVAEFFSRRSGFEPRFALIPKADCFGYLTRRSEYELLVRLTPERMPLVYPDRFQKP